MTYYTCVLAIYKEAMNEEILEAMRALDDGCTDCSIFYGVTKSFILVQYDANNADISPAWMKLKILAEALPLKDGCKQYKGCILDTDAIEDMMFGDSDDETLTIDYITIEDVEKGFDTFDRFKYYYDTMCGER